MRRPYLLWKRGRVWCYKLPEIKHYLSTGQNTRKAAEHYVMDILNKKRTSVPCYYTFRRYAEPCFAPETPQILQTFNNIYKVELG